MKTYKWLLVVLLLALAGCMRKIEYRGVTYTCWGNQRFGWIQIDVNEPNGVEWHLIVEDQKSDFQLGFEAAGAKARIGGVE